MELSVPHQGWAFLELPGVELGLDRPKTRKTGEKTEVPPGFLGDSGGKWKGLGFSLVFPEV